MIQMMPNIFRDEDILERPRICLYQDEWKQTQTGVLLRIRSGQNFIFLVTPKLSKTYGDYIESAVVEFEILMEKRRRFDPFNFEALFKKVDPEDYGKSYYVYLQPDHWSINNHQNAAVYTKEKFDTPTPWDKLTEEELYMRARDYDYDDIDAFVKEDDQYRFLYPRDVKLQTEDIPRPMYEKGYALLGDVPDVLLEEKKDWF